MTTKARAEDKEKKARGELRVVEDELRVARDELHMFRDELRIKATTLSRVSREASEAVSFVECLSEECHGLRGDLRR